MAIYCCAECEMAGSSCDDCKNFIPDELLTGYSTSNGICKETREKVSVFDGANCEYFICRSVLK